MRLFLIVGFHAGRIAGRMERADQNANRLLDAALGARRAYEQAVAARLPRPRREAVDAEMQRALDAVRTTRARLTLTAALLNGGSADAIESWLERQTR